MSARGWLDRFASPQLTSLWKVFTEYFKLTKGRKFDMVWVLDGSIWREGAWYVSHCKDLEIASQGKTVQEARENLEEAIRLFFEVASYTEVMEYLSCLDPIPPSEIQGQPEIRVMPAHHDSQKVKCEVALNNAWTQT